MLPVIYGIILKYFTFSSFLFSSPDSVATCWYILLSGSVFVKEHMYLARCWYVLISNTSTHTAHAVVNTDTDTHQMCKKEMSRAVSSYLYYIGASDDTVFRADVSPSLSDRYVPHVNANPGIWRLGI